MSYKEMLSLEKTSLYVIHEIFNTLNAGEFGYLDIA